MKRGSGKQPSGLLFTVSVVYRKKILAAFCVAGFMNFLRLRRRSGIDQKGFSLKKKSA